MRACIKNFKKFGFYFRKNSFTFLLLICISLFSIDVYACGSEAIRNHDLISNSFSNDEVLVVLDKENSKNLKKYSLDDFKDINCTKVEDLTSTATESVLNNNYNSLVDVNNYKRVLCIELSDKSKENVLSAIDILNDRDDVIYAGPNYNIKSLSTSPNDTYRSEQWALNSIKLPQAWDFSTGSANVLVGVVDTGIDSFHQDISSRLVRNLCKDFSNDQDSNDSYPIDDIGHGTHVAGIIGAVGNNNSGVCGTNWNIGVVSLKVFDENNECNVNRLINAINYAQSNNIPILNMSLGAYGDVDLLGPYISSYSGLIVAAAGNDSVNIDNNHIYPACSDSSNIITVGSIDQDNNRSSFSNYGQSSVDIYAPGTNILSIYPTHLCEELDYVFSDGTRLCEIGYNYRQDFIQIIELNSMTWEDFDENFSDIIDLYYGYSAEPSYFAISTHKVNGYHYMSGTSMATPYVAGVAALLLSENSSLSASQLKNAILNRADSITISTSAGSQTVKKLNAYSSIQNVHNNHNYVEWIYNNHISHIEVCSKCGDTGTLTEPHMISSQDVGKRFARCIGCNFMLDLRSDVANIQGYSIFRKKYVTNNGSYVLSNGIIVLVDADYELYKNGQLVLEE